MQKTSKGANHAQLSYLQHAVLLAGVRIDDLVRRNAHVQNLSEVQETVVQLNVWGHLINGSVFPICLAARFYRMSETRMRMQDHVHAKVAVCLCNVTAQEEASNTFRGIAWGGARKYLFNLGLAGAIEATAGIG
jgi:hypothetical protein